MSSQDVKERIAQIRETLAAMKVARDLRVEEELEGVEIVKAILGKDPRLDGERVKYEEGVICLDDVRKPICRLEYQGREKMLILFDVPKDVTNMGNMKGWFVEVTGNSDLSQYKAELMQTLEGYLDGTP